MEATGSQNRDEHPIPKEIVTPTIPYSQLLAREEEDEILGLGTTATPSPTTPDKVQQLKAEIVEHCRDMRKSLMSMTKADHHRAALRENLRTKEFPKGLCAYVQPHIFEPDEIVLAEWEIAHTEFRKELLAILIRHYEKKVRAERDHQDSQCSKMLRHIKEATLSDRDTEYLNCLWQEETSAAFAEAKKYASVKAEQRNCTNEKRRTEKSSASTPREQLPPKNRGDLHLRVEELQKELKQLQGKQELRGRQGYRGYRGKPRSQPRNKRRGPPKTTETVEESYETIFT